MGTRDRYVPRRVGRLTDELCDRPWVDGDESEHFAAFSRLVSALYHLEAHEEEQQVLDRWDRMAEDPAVAAELRAALEDLLRDANYTEVTDAELHEAMERESLIPLRLEVDLDEYEQLLICRRDSRREEVEVPKWKGLRHEQRTITVEDRVVVLAKVRPSEWFEERGIDPAKRNLVPGRVTLKQFQEVPRADIEMLLPSTRVRYRPIDTAMVAIPAVASGIVVLATKLLPTIGLIMVLFGAWVGLRDQQPELDQAALVVLLGGVITIGGFLFRQWSSVKNRRVNYLKTLSEVLYFRTLADGPGVLHILLSSAAQQQVVEVLLAYRFALDRPGGQTVAELDRRVEEWLAEVCARDIDFEVDDAVAKLVELDLIEPGPQIVPVSLPVALSSLDRRWDDTFHHPSDAPAVPLGRGASS